MIVVQVGANRGYDELTSIIQNQNINKLILIEPIDKFNNSLITCYQHIIDKVYIENIVITDDESQDKLTMYLHQSMDHNVEQGSILESHVNKIFNQPEYNLNKNYNEQLIKIQVKCLTINNLFKKYNLQNIDILFIDAEGFDDKIIKNINFDKYNIKQIYYENMHINNIELSSFLTKTGYSIQNGTNISIHNNLATKNE